MRVRFSHQRIQIEWSGVLLDLITGLGFHDTQAGRLPVCVVAGRTKGWRQGLRRCCIIEIKKRYHIHRGT